MERTHLTKEHGGRLRSHGTTTYGFHIHTFKKDKWLRKWNKQKQTNREMHSALFPWMPMSRSIVTFNGAWFSVIVTPVFPFFLWSIFFEAVLMPKEVSWFSFERTCKGLKIHTVTECLLGKRRLCVWFSTPQKNGGNNQTLIKLALQWETAILDRCPIF